ncbi:MAG TPA: glycosyltransferase family 87 protein [Planktothrix sp.]|jgi:hypothetical protein
MNRSTTLNRLESATLPGDLSPLARGNKWCVIVFALAAIAFAMPVAENCRLAPKYSAAEDFKSYYAFSYVLRHTPGKIYEPKEILSTVHSLFPESNTPLAFPPPIQVLPTTLPLVVPFSLWPSDSVVAFWSVLTALAAAAATFLLARQYKFSVLGTSFLMLAAALSGPYHSLIRLGEPGPLGVLCLAGIFFCLKNKRPYAAAVLLAALTLKPHWILPLSAFLFGARRYKTIGLFVAICAGIAVLSLVLFGTQTWSDYIPLSKLLTDNPWMFGIQQAVSASAQIYRFFPQIPYRQIAIVGGGIYALSLLALVWLGNRVRNQEEWLELGILSVFPIGIACSFYYTPYDMFLLLPTVAVLFSNGNWRRISTADKWIVGVSLAMLMNPLYHLLIGKVVTEHKAVINPFYVGTWCIAVALAKIVLRRRMTEKNSDTLAQCN